VSAPAVGGNGASDGGAAIDLAAAAADLATPHAVDQSMPLGDLASGAQDLAAACVATGGSCPNHNDAICCSHYCVYATNSCK